MKGSLRDQLLKAGFAKPEPPRQADPKRQRGAGEARPAPAGPEPPAQELAARLAVEERALYAQRDRELQRAREAGRARKGFLAEARRLLQEAAEPHGQGDVRYHFVERGKVKRLYVDRAQQAALAAGRLAVAGLDGRHYLVPPEVALRAREILSEVRVAVVEPPGSGPDDPYAAYPVPDDAEG